MWVCREDRLSNVGKIGGSLSQVSGKPRGRNPLAGAALGSISTTSAPATCVPTTIARRVIKKMIKLKKPEKAKIVFANNMNLLGGLWWVKVNHREMVFGKKHNMYMPG